jgi:hypothetical protein
MLPREAFGTIVAAVIAAFISLVGLIISKENKVSEFRQAWIDSLRAEVAAVITHGFAIYQAFDAARDIEDLPGESLGWLDIRSDVVNLGEATEKVRLRVNATEKPSIVLLELLKEHEALFQDFDGAPDANKLTSVSTRLSESTREILKEEWEKVKSGESIYRTARWTAVALVLVGLVYLFFVLLG